MTTRICSIPDCDRTYRARGLCASHYQRLRKYGDPQADKPLRAHAEKPCATTGCTKAALTRGLCPSHYMAHRSRQQAYGRWESSHVDAQPVREHILALLAAGISNRQLKRICGVSHNTIQVILTGRPERGSGPTKQVLRRTAEKLLAVPVPDIPWKTVADGRPVPAIGTTRRLRALVAIGYSQSDLARRLGILPTNATPLFAGTRDTVLASTARAVADLFNELQLTPGTSSRARNRAARLGWPLPLDWDEDRIDDPNHRIKRSTADDLRRSRGQEARQQAEVRKQRVIELTEQGWSAAAIAERLGVTDKTVVRDRNEHRHQDEEIA